MSSFLVFCTLLHTAYFIELFTSLYRTSYPLERGRYHISYLYLSTLVPMWHIAWRSDLLKCSCIFWRSCASQITNWTRPPLSPHTLVTSPTINGNDNGDNHPKTFERFENFDILPRQIHTTTVFARQRVPAARIHFVAYSRGRTWRGNHCERTGWQAKQGTWRKRWVNRKWWRVRKGLTRKEWCKCGCELLGLWTAEVCRAI